jgi:Cdc6-like AAA superfamily ATPase
LSSSGLLASLARGVGKPASIRRERNLDELSSYLCEHERQTLVIVLDDAQNSTHSTLEELRLLLGLNLPSQPTFALILIGDEYLLGQLQLRNHRALCSRLSAHHLLTPWTLEEIQGYLKTGLEAVGINRSRVFEPAAVDLLVRATAGIPNDAFKKNANTQVTIDIVMLRKRLPGELQQGPAWRALSEIINSASDTITINEYFAAQSSPRITSVSRSS